jgi:uncharacterized protein (DUF305 family)
MTATPGTTGTNGTPSGSEVGDGVSAEPGPAQPRRRGVLVFMLVAGAIVLLLVGATAGLALSGRLLGSADATPDTASVDAGFARDMIVHHDQGVLMAHYAEKNTTDPEIDVMAYDIGYTQTDQIGQMQGWLSLWDLPESGDGTHMGWMGAAVDSHGMTMGASTATSAPAAASGTAAGSGTAAAEVPLMPGMATASEIAKLQGLTGAASDTYFLQLMIRHHQGGVPMMQYAAEHATSPVVRNFASKMAQSQESEISVMTQMLAERGAQPLPAPAG